MKFKIALSALALVIPFAANANLVINGDFEAGNTGFTSDYILVDPNGTSPFPTPPAVPASSDGAPGSENMYNEGTYTVTNAQPGAWHASWRNNVDLAGHGWYMLMNGSIVNPNTTRVWEQNIAALVVGTTYRLQFDIVNVFGGGENSTIRFRIGANEIASVETPSGAAQWQTVFADFLYTGGSSDATILNAEVAEFGNDFGIDNIILEVAPVPEPFTMVLGAAGIGVFLRRRMKAKKS